MEQKYKYILLKNMLQEGKEKGFRIPTTFFDLISILLGLFMFISMLQNEQIKREYQVKVDILKKQIQNPHSLQPDVDTPTLSVIPAGKDGEYSFILNSKNFKQNILSKPEEAKRIIADIRPAKIILRVAKQVPAGILQGLIMDCQDLNVIPFISAQN